MEDQLLTMPRIGDMAPDFEAMTTTGKMKFSEYIKGKWTILFSHPADFTPVCTTKMSGIAVGRLTEERKNWRKDHPPGFYARPVKKEDNSTDIMSWETGIPGREGSRVSFRSTWFEQN